MVVALKDYQGALNLLNLLVSPICRVVGPARARELIYTARVLKGPEAADLGLVNDPCRIRSLW